MSNNIKKNNREFIVKEFQEVTGGWYDNYGFYYTLNGSFWDEKGYYFNKEGKDKYGGCYDDNFNYLPGKGWDYNKECYLSELDGEDYCDDFEDEGDYYDEDHLAHDLECADLDDYENLIKDDYEQLIKEDFKKIDLSGPNEKHETKNSGKIDQIGKVEEKNAVDEKSEKIEPRKNRLDDLFSNTSDKTGKIKKASPKKSKV